MSSDDKVTQLEVQLQKAKAERAAWKATEEQQIAEEKVAAEVKRVTEEKAVVEVRCVEEWRRAMAVAKAWVEELAAARCKTVLAMAETAVEEAKMEQVVGLPAKQKEQVEGKQLACDRCTTQGFDCQVSLMVDFF